MKSDIEKRYDQAITEYLTTAPDDPRRKELLAEVIEATKQAADAGLVKAMKV
jgi:hypothetical protein